MTHTVPDHETGLAHEAAPVKAVSQFQDALAHTAECHRALTEEMVLHARDETLRFWNLRLERNGQALARMQDCAGLDGLIQAQQEWMRGWMKDYADQGMRTFGLMRGMAKDTLATAETIAEASAEHAGEAVKDAAAAAGDFASHATVADDDEIAAGTHH